MFAKLWMVGVQRMPHSNQNIQVSIEWYHGVLKHWFALDTKGLKGHRIDWLVWWLTITIADHYMHTLELKKKCFIINKVMETIVTRSVEKGNLYSTHPCVPTNPWEWWSLGCTEPTPSQCYLRSEIPIHWNILLHMWMGIARECVNTKLYSFSHA
jgi:hypothetical protein